MERLRHLSGWVLLAGLFLALSCTTEELLNQYTAQEKIIEELIKKEQEKNPEATLTSSKGSDRLTLKAGEGEGLSTDGSLDFYYAAYVLSRSGLDKRQLFATNHEQTAKDCQWKLSDSTVFQIARLSLKDDKPVKGLKNGLAGVQKGEECLIFFTSREAIGSKKLTGVPQNSGLIYHIWVDQVNN